VDDRVRLLSAVLAATDYPDKSQARRKHGTHAHARGTRKLVAEYAHHPAVHAMQVLLNQGIPLASMYNYLLRLTWPGLTSDEEMPRWVPPRWHEHLKHFYEQTGLHTWWESETIQWETPVRHLRDAFNSIDMYNFFEPFVGYVAEMLVFMPNISYPSDQSIGLRIGGELVAIMPPPIAWGDSPPWPYKDDPALAYRAALGEYGGLLMGAYMRQHESIIKTLAEKPLPIDDKYAAVHPTWQDQFMGVFKASTTALFLESVVSALEAKSFLQYMQKVENLTVLPGVVNVFRRYLDEYKAGHYKNFAEYLPNLPKHLRVAKTISAL
jgi:hypothetical protein